MIDTSLIPARGSDIRSVVKTAEIPGTPEQAFDDWASEEGLKRWWIRSGLNVDLRVGGPFELYFNQHEPEGTRGSEGCQYLSYVPGEMISFTWNAPPHLPLRSSHTWVVITFRGTHRGTTKVRLVHTGFLEGPDWDDYIDYFENAWGIVLHRQERLHDAKD